jgi:uncharacterized protein (DUF2141 family)
MDRYYRISLAFLIFIFSSCAEVEGIDGGPKDSIAPRIKSISPENKSTNFTSRKINYQFDEFIKINNPQENIVILPAGLKVKATIHKKELELELEGEFAANTTYQISLNSVIKDNREGNDSLMKYIFSTGDFLDSISYSGKIVDAYTNELQNNITVALYTKDDSITSKPLYFVRTDKTGKFSLDYLKPGKYQMYAFNDINKDLIFQYKEKVGFSDSSLSIQTSFTDSTAYRIFQNNLPKKIKDKKLIYPRKLVVSSTYSLFESSFYFLNQQIKNENIYFYKEDSIAIILPENPQENNQLLIQSNTKDTNKINLIEFEKDTISFYANLNNLTQIPSVEFFPLDKDISKFKTFTLYFSDEIDSINNELIEIQSVDSIKIIPTYSFKNNRLDFSFSDTLQKDILFKIKANAIQFLNHTKNEVIDHKLIIKPKSNYSILNFKNMKFPENTILEILIGNKVVETIHTSKLMQNSVISYLNPGEYSFRLILDENNNNKWDVGDVFFKKQAEKILYFSQKVKLRANWESEIELELNPESKK